MNLDAPRFTVDLEKLGDSVLVVGDDRTLRVHVHTDDPDAAAVALFDSAGKVSHFDVADMHEQVAERSARLAGDLPRGEQSTCAVVAVASGEGVKRLFADLGVLVVDGGPTMNPSTYELLAGIHASPGSEVESFLPNSPNVILAAERACELSEKPAAVVPTTAPQEGLAALLAFDPDRPARENAAAVSSAKDALRMAASRRRRATTPRAASSRARLLATPAASWWRGATQPRRWRRRSTSWSTAPSSLTCIAGEAPPLGQDDVQANVPDGVELEYHEGGQPAWWWLLCAE